MSTTSPGGFKAHLPNITGDDPADGETVQWDATAKAWKSVAPSGGGGASTLPGQAAHYIGTWDIAVTYAAGDCVRQWTGSVFKLYQAKKATTGDDPTSVVASWAEVTTPIVMWGSEDPLTADAANPHGGGIPGFNGACFIHANDNIGIGAFWVFNTYVDKWVGEFDTDITHDGTNVLFVEGGASVYVHGSGPANVTAAAGSHRGGTGTGNAASGASATRSDAGDGGANVDRFATRSGSGAGNAEGFVSVEIADTAVGTATAGDTAIHHTGGEAHVLPTADASGARNDVKADIIFTDNTEGPVIHDQTDGHTYRIVSTAGVLSTVQVT